MIDTITTQAAQKADTNVRRLRLLLLIVREMFAPATSREIAARLRSYDRR